MMATDFFDSHVLFAVQPILWHLLSALAFIVTIHQPQKSRWLFLPLIILPLVQCYRTVHLLPGGLDWIYAFTSIVTITHTTSVLYIENWIILPPNSKDSRKWNVSAAFKLWMDPRRISYNKLPTDTRPTSQYRHIIFILRKLSHILILSMIYTVVELLLLLLRPQPSDFSLPRQTYIHLHIDRQALLRSVYAFYWAWLTYLILTVAHTIMSIVFVGVLQLHTPSEWPSLYGNPFKITSLRSFWGRFWHHLGSPSQASHGRLVIRRVLGLSASGSSEKAFLAFWIFLASGITHVFVSWKAEPNAKDHFSDLKFLIVNFFGGLVEAFVARWAWTRTLGATARYRSMKGILGFLWVFVFFYVTVPPYQYPILYETAMGRLDAGSPI
ncbi:hypothetical protein ONS96_001619 [Cadophora gregata f. sp. sojae]|nr:hypothetical protein ONS96_001619 [Cadophora gregata f. sp. sojae]